MKRAPKRKQRQITGSRIKKNRCKSNGSSLILFSANSFEDVFGDVRAAVNNSTARQERGKTAFLGNFADCLQNLFTDRVEEFLFPFGWGELWGIADRTDYDLTQHQNVSGQDLTYFDDEKKQKYIPYVIEPSLGADRVVLAFLCSAYDEEVLDAEKNDVRTVLHFHPALAPVKIGVLPLSKKLNEGAEKIYQQLSKKYNCEYDDRGNIGKRYRRQDEIGTPFCVTYDFESENDGAVTIRDRDTMEQVRVKIDELDAYFADKFTF